MIERLFLYIQVEHGCSVASVGGSRGVLVVGGATGDDVVEFLDWDIRQQWKVLGMLFIIYYYTFRWKL